jgi:hypothetical protein
MSKYSVLMTRNEVNGLKSDDWADAGIEIKTSNANNIPVQRRFIVI